MHSIKLMWIVVAIVLVASLFIGGYGLGTVGLSKNIVQTTDSYKTGYNAGKEDARIKIAESGMFPPAPLEITSITGTVASNDGEKIVITGASKISPNPLDPQGPNERTINVTDKTVITAIIPLTPTEFSDAMNKYNYSKQGLPPNPFYQKNVAIGDIKLTMQITVGSETDIAQARIIDAKSITFNAIPSTVPMK